MQLERLVAETEGGVINASGWVSLSDEFKWQLDTRLDRFNLKTLPAWLGEVTELDASGYANGDLAAQGTINPISWSAKGDLVLPKAILEGVTFEDGKLTAVASAGDTADVRVTGELRASTMRGPALGRGSVEDVFLAYELTAEEADIQQVRGRIGDGTFEANAVWPLSDVGSARVKGSWADVDLGPFFASSTRRQSFSLHADSRGEFDWSAPTDSILNLKTHKLTAAAEVPNIVINGRPSGKMQLDITQPSRQVEYVVSGQLFGGVLEGHGLLVRNPDEAREAAQQDDQQNGNSLGEVVLREVDLGEFARTILRDAGRNWRGKLSITAQTRP